MAPKKSKAVDKQKMRRLQQKKQEEFLNMIHTLKEATVVPGGVQTGSSSSTETERVRITMRRYNAMKIFLAVPPSSWPRIQEKIVEMTIPAAHTMKYLEMHAILAYMLTGRTQNYTTTAALEILTAERSGETKLVIPCGVD